MRPPRPFLISALCLFAVAFPTAADQPCDPATYPGLGYSAHTTEASSFLDAVRAAGSDVGAEHTLVVFDIDNTLLTMLDDLGSDQWYRWQSRLNEKPATAMAVAAAGDEMQRDTAMLDVQRLLTAALPMHLTQPDMPQQIQAIQQAGFPVMALTARGPETAAATRRELVRNGLRLETTAPGVESGPLDLTSERPARYEHGVLMVSGQDKGLMLQQLLLRLEADYQRIFLLDDREKNLCNMVRAYRDTPGKVTAVRYDRVRAWAQGFLSDPDRKRATDAAWRSIERRLPGLCDSVPTACGKIGRPDTTAIPAVPVPITPPAPTQAAPEPGTAAAGTGDAVKALLPPDELAGPALREWLRQHWWEGRHRDIGYEAARQAMYSQIDVGADGRVHGVYSGFSLPALRPGAKPGKMLPIEADHTVPQSWFGERSPMRSDIHHLFPAHKEPNRRREQDSFSEIPDLETEVWYGARTGLLVEQNEPPAADIVDTFGEARGKSPEPSELEPPEGHKGDLARAASYFYTMYPGEAQHDIGQIAADGLERLHRWHLADPPDDWERRRNDRIEATQGNRNPYVDHPGLLCRAWGLTCPDGH